MKNARVFFLRRSNSPDDDILTVLRLYFTVLRTIGGGKFAVAHPASLRGGKEKQQPSDWRTTLIRLKPTPVISQLRSLLEFLEGQESSGHCASHSKAL